MAAKKKKGPPKKKAGKKAVKKAGKLGRDFRGFKKSTGEYDKGPGPIASVMGLGGMQQNGQNC